MATGLVVTGIDRARESGEIIASVFSVPCESHEILWSENGHPEDLAGALSLVHGVVDGEEKP